MPAAKKQIAKSDAQLLNALEEHLFTLVQSLIGLHTGDAAYVKDISTKLRLLISGSSGQQGFLWEVAAKVRADDKFQIRYPGKLDRNNPQTDDTLIFGKFGDPVPRRLISLQHHLMKHEAIFVGGHGWSFSQVIKELAEQSGTAHETPGVSIEMARANSTQIGHVHPFIPIVDRIARWTLEFGEIVIQQAIIDGYKRQRSKAEAPEEVELERRKFRFPLDGPKQSEDPDQGTIMTGLYLADFVKAKELGQPVHFLPVRYGSICFDFRASRKGRLIIRGTGLAIPNYAVECAVTGDVRGLVSIFITWQHFDIRVYVNEIQTSGCTTP